MNTGNSCCLREEKPLSRGQGEDMLFTVNPFMYELNF